MGKTERAIKLKKLDTALRDLDHESADHYRRTTASIREARELIADVVKDEKESDSQS